MLCPIASSVRRALTVSVFLIIASSLYVVLRDPQFFFTTSYVSGDSLYQIYLPRTKIFSLTGSLMRDTYEAASRLFLCLSCRNWLSFSNYYILHISLQDPQFLATCYVRWKSTPNFIFLEGKHFVWLAHHFGTLTGHVSTRWLYVHNKPKQSISYYLLTYIWHLTF